MATKGIPKSLLNLIIPERYVELHSKGNNAFQHSGKGNAIGQTVELQAVRKDGKEIEMKRGLKAIQGVCPDCGTKVFRILGKKK